MSEFKLGLTSRKPVFGTSEQIRFKPTNSASQNSLIIKVSNMAAHVLLNLLIGLGKSDKIRGLPGILLLFRNELNTPYSRLLR